jgi:hypothetical protein
VFAPAVLAPDSPLAAPESPLAAPDSPLPPPAQPVAEATPTPLPPVIGSWQLGTIRAASTMSETAAPPGYRLIFGPTGVVRVAADCKTGRGQYTRTPEGALTLDITFGDVRCAPDSLADPLAQALAEVSSYRFEEDRLVLSYGTQGGEMGFTRFNPMGALGAFFLNWDNLKYNTFLLPDAPVRGGQVPLVDGEFRARVTPDPAAAVTDTAASTATAALTDTANTPIEFVVSLATMHTYTDLDPPTPEPTPAEPPPADATPTPTPEPEIAMDSVVVLVVNEGDAAPKSYLAPVLNGGGLAIPLTLELLGENVYVRDLRWNGTQLIVDFDQGTEGKRRVYAFETDRFVQVSEEGLQPRPAKAQLDLPPQDVILSPGGAAGSAAESSLTGAIETGVVHPYRLAAQAGQLLTVTLQSPYDDVWLSLYGASDRTVLRSIRRETSSWSGAVPVTQEYIAAAVASGSSSPYTLTIQLAGVGQAPVVTATQATTAPTGAGVVHLVIDGPPTPPLLDVLQRNNAQADFFLTAEQALAAGESLAAALAGGNGTGIIAGPIAALTSSGRDELLAEVSAVRQSLGEGGGKCLRPPYAATDGYTRAAAAELGFDVLLWDIDAGTAAADALATQVFPGAVIRFGETGSGDAAATLEGLLPLLAQQGYTVQAACR